MEPESCIVAPVLSQRLPAGVWLGKADSGASMTIVFYENGLAQWNLNADQQNSTTLYHWETIPGAGGCAYLRLTNRESGATSNFAVDVICNRLQLIGTDFSSIALEQVKRQEGEQKRRLLNGAWGNTTYPFEVSRQRAPDMKQAYLQYQFSEDGTFVRKLGNQKHKIQETGTYLVSDDGDYLLLQFDEGCVTVVALKYLRLDELVLQHVLRCEDPAFATGRKDFYFNKL